MRLLKKILTTQYVGNEIYQKLTLPSRIHDK